MKSTKPQQQIRAIL